MKMLRNGKIIDGNKNLPQAYTTRKKIRQQNLNLDPLHVILSNKKRRLEELEQDLPRKIQKLDNERSELQLKLDTIANKKVELKRQVNLVEQEMETVEDDIMQKEIESSYADPKKWSRFYDEYCKTPFTSHTSYLRLYGYNEIDILHVDQYLHYTRQEFDDVVKFALENGFRWSKPKAKFKLITKQFGDKAYKVKTEYDKLIRKHPNISTNLFQFEDDTTVYLMRNLPSLDPKHHAQFLTKIRQMYSKF